MGSLPEEGDTYAANAMSKALAVARATGRVALADDSGLEVDALEGAPGVHSSRWLGDQAADADRNAAVLARLRGVPPERPTAAVRDGGQRGQKDKGPDQPPCPSRAIRPSLPGDACARRRRSANRNVQALSGPSRRGRSRWAGQAWPR